MTCLVSIYLCSAIELAYFLLIFVYYISCKRHFNLHQWRHLYYLTNSHRDHPYYYNHPGPLHYCPHSSPRWLSCLYLMASYQFDSTEGGNAVSLMLLCYSIYVERDSIILKQTVFFISYQDFARPILVLLRATVWTSMKASLASASLGCSSLGAAA